MIPPLPLRRQLFTGATSQKRVTEELMGYSDYSLHAFCYNSGSAFAEYRLNSTHLLTSTKFRYLAQLLPRLKVGGLREVYVLFSGCAVLKKGVLAEHRLQHHPPHCIHQVPLPRAAAAGAIGRCFLWVGREGGAGGVPLPRTVLPRLQVALAPSRP